MPVANRYLFVSYLAEDLPRVRHLVDAVSKELASRLLPVELWDARTHLRPGEQWNVAIARALDASIGFLFFVSRDSLSSEWVQREWELAAVGASNRLIITVMLEEQLDVPLFLRRYTWVQFVGRSTKEATVKAAATIVNAAVHYLKATPQPRAPVTKAEGALIAADIAQQVRSSIEPASVEAQPNSVFVVHGHGTEVLTELEKYLKSVGVVPIILSRRDESPQSLFQKFMAIGGRARFAIVLLSADDYGASRRQYDAIGIGDRALQFRSRQNVILELGYFYGRLGWENVFVVYQGPDLVFPNFERPSDLEGVVFDSISDADWQMKLGAKLTAAGFDLVLSG